MMRSVLRCSVAAAVLTMAAFMAPAMAQSASDNAVRMSQLEDQMRQLTGEVEALTNQVRQLKAQMASNAGSAAPVQQQAPLKLKKLSAVAPSAPAAAPMAGDSSSSDIQVTDQAPADQAPADQTAMSADTSTGVEEIQDSSTAAAPATVQPRKTGNAKVLGGLAGSTPSAQPGDGGFQGQVLVAPGQQDAGDDASVVAQQQQLAAVASQATDGSVATDGGVQQVALNADTPEALYERSNESLLRRQFGDAEAGFRTFLQKYPDHALAGNAQYWLGETFYAQSDFRQAAQAFLQGFKKYPDGRRAPDSLLKLGISLNRLGQTQQACSAFATVDANYPKAVDARRRAQAEAKRANCAS